MLGLRLDRLLALILLVFPLLNPYSSSADPTGAMVDVEKSAPNVMTVGPAAVAVAKTAPNPEKEATPSPDQPLAEPDAAGMAPTPPPNLDRPIPAATTDASAAVDPDAPIIEQL